MKLIVITAEPFFEGEPEAIRLLFKQGLERLHIRKPYASFDETKRFVERIDAAFHPRIVLHDHYELAHIFRVKGIHLNSRNPSGSRVLFRAQGLTISRSCHSFEEIESCREEMDDVFLSPVFDSISKTGYKRRFTPEQLNDARNKGLINERVIALGGITAAGIPAVRAYGFGGVAVLGSLWAGLAADRDTGGLLERFNELKTNTRRKFEK
ncbi:MAG: thiamine phosphate synthase [Tannerella sp.]|jgi:thiamine-phosphate pyrophosphorylase|nr:thiamine phosphate synthase [Tannerella sp.]